MQGSGRLRLTDGRVLRLGYAGQNGHPYRSLGREMVARGLIPQDRIGADTMRAWFRDNPDRVTELLILNPSWVYFRELTGLGPDDGPIGTAGVPLVPMVSLAVDPAHVPLGAPVLLNTTVDGAPFAARGGAGYRALRAQRGDIYFGTGARADCAGRQNALGCLTVLLPRDM